MESVKSVAFLFFLDLIAGNEEAMHLPGGGFMKAVLTSLLIVLIACTFACAKREPAVQMSAATGANFWPYWRGPAADGIAAGDAPLHWSDAQNIKWKADIPGRGHSSPVIWGDRIFVTTAIRNGPPDPPPAPGAKPPLVTSGPQAEHSFDVICLDRKTGKILWQRTATKAVPHEGYHGTYGSFASNSPVTDGKQCLCIFWLPRNVLL